MPAGHYDRTRIPRRGRPGFFRAIVGDVDRDWMSRAVCHQLPMSEVDELFFPIDGRSHAAKREYQEKVQRAKRICNACPVKQECRDYRASIQDPNGVWGGLDERDRRPEKPKLVALTDWHCPGSGHPPTRTKGRARGLCPGCGRYRSLRLDGRMFNHGRNP